MFFLLCTRTVLSTPTTDLFPLPTFSPFPSPVPHSTNTPSCEGQLTPSLFPPPATSLLPACKQGGTGGPPSCPTTHFCMQAGGAGGPNHPSPCLPLLHVLASTTASSSHTHKDEFFLLSFSFLTHLILNRAIPAPAVDPHVMTSRDPAAASVSPQCKTAKPPRPTPLSLSSPQGDTPTLSCAPCGGTGMPSPFPSTHDSMQPRCLGVATMHNTQRGPTPHPTLHSLSSPLG